MMPRWASSLEPALGEVGFFAITVERTVLVPDPGGGGGLNRTKAIRIARIADGMRTRGFVA